ncbi:MAG: MFS transporter [Actinomycetia bacterium]|nr:MFS transporter [Actinomycetes bacterium]
MAATPASVYGLRDFRRLWFAEVVSKAGSNLTEVALAVLAFRLAGDKTLAYAGVLFVDLLPAALLGWAGGLLADRLDRRRLLVAVNLVRGVLVASIPLVGTLWWAYVAVFLSQVGAVAYRPTLKALIPEAVGPERILAANAALEVGTSAVDIPAYLLGAALLLNIGLMPTFLGDGASFAAAAAAVAGLSGGLGRAPAPAETGDTPRGMWEDVRAGIAYHGEHRVLLRLLLLFMLGAFGLVGVNVLSAAFVHDVLRGPEGLLGWLLAALAAGRWVAGWAMGRLAPPPRAYPLWVWRGFASAGVWLLLLATAPAFPLAVLLFMGLGLANGLLVVPLNAWIQGMVPLAMRGRVYAARATGLAWAGAASVGLTGVLATAWGVRWTLAILAAFVFLVSAWAWGWLSAEVPAAGTLGS